MRKAGSFLSKQELNCRDEKEITVRFAGKPSDARYTFLFLKLA